MSSPFVYSSQGSAPASGSRAAGGPQRRTKSIISGRGVTLGEERNPSLIDFLTTCGWANFHINFPESYFPELVYEFYENATFSNRGGDKADPVLSTRVRGTEIQLTCENIGLPFFVPNAGEKIYFKIKGTEENLLPHENMGNFYTNLIGAPTVRGQIQNCELRDELRLLNAYIRANIVPKAGGHSDEIPSFQAFVLHCLITGRQLNLSYLMIKCMDHSTKDTRKSYPYGGFLTHIFHMFGVIIPDDEPTMRCEQPIGEYTITQHNVQKRSSRKRRENVPDMDQNDPAY